MKKIIYFLALVLISLFSSCELMEESEEIDYVAAAQKKYDSLIESELPPLLKSEVNEKTKFTINGSAVFYEDTEAFKTSTATFMVGEGDIIVYHDSSHGGSGEIIIAYKNITDLLVMKIDYNVLGIKIQNNYVFFKCEKKTDGRIFYMTNELFTDQPCHLYLYGY